MITKLHKEYIQKSRLFLYPLLDIRKGSEAVPIESYISWTGQHAPEDMKFVCVYHLRDDDVFRRFEKNKLTSNKLFHSYYETVDDEGVYVFDMTEYTQDWDKFLTGKYSTMTADTKNKILKFFMANKSNYHQINSYLNPEIYYEQYANLLNVSEKILRDVGELCSKPDLEKENLKAEIKSISLFQHL
jgi:hypothetical protein